MLDDTVKDDGDNLPAETYDDIRAEIRNNIFRDAARKVLANIRQSQEIINVPIIKDDTCYICGSKQEVNETIDWYYGKIKKCAKCWQKYNGTEHEPAPVPKKPKRTKWRYRAIDAED